MKLSRRTGIVSAAWRNGGDYIPAQRGVSSRVWPLILGFPIVVVVVLVLAVELGGGKSLRSDDGDEEDHDEQEKCFWDLTRFRSPAFSLVVNQVLFVELAYSLIQVFLRQIERGGLAGATRQRLLDALLPQENQATLYTRRRFALFASYDHQELLLRRPEGARRKALGKTRRLRRAQLRSPDLPWRHP